MSQPSLSSFNWPTAAPGALEKPSLSSSASVSTSIVPSGVSNNTATITPTATTLQITSMTQRAGSIMIPSPNKTVYVTITLTVSLTPTADVSVGALIDQTQTLDLHASMMPTKIGTPVPKVTIASFDLVTPLAEPLVSISAEPTPTKLNSGPIPDLSSSQTTTPIALPSSLSPSEIAGITLGLITFIVALFAFAIFLYRHRKAKKACSDTEAAKPAKTLAEKTERARDLGRKQWTKHDTALNKERYKKLKQLMVANNRAAAEKKAAAAKAQQGDAATELQEAPQMSRPEASLHPYGLAMHPPTPVDSTSMQNGELNVGRAV